MDVQPLQPHHGLGLCQGEALGAEDLPNTGRSEVFSGPPSQPRAADPSLLSSLIPEHALCFHCWPSQTVKSNLQSMAKATRWDRNEELQSKSVTPCSSSYKNPKKMVVKLRSTTPQVCRHHIPQGGKPEGAFPARKGCTVSLCSVTLFLPSIFLWRWFSFG